MKNISVQSKGMTTYTPPTRQLILTSSDHTNPENSPLYQNPYWGLTPDTPAEQ